MFDLTGKIAVVTGGARGIGKGICSCLATQGAGIAMIDVLEKEADETCKELKQLGRTVRFYRADITDRESIVATMQRIISDFEKVDILVNNAGWDKIEPFVKNTPDVWEKIVQINYMGTIHCTRAVVEHMMSRNRGRIINISSDAGRVGSTGEAVYSGTKGAIIAFSKTMARELARNNVTVNTVCPGPTMTPMITAMVEVDEFVAKVFAAMDRIIPLRRMGAPEDIGAAVTFLASDEANFITGQTLSVSGGLTMA
ncbi:MAG: 3-oxoacyl-ACP reductase FabG [Deltaproteobacteria bacterium]|nr:3-oxoacyl-ACP reductase FabG [Deltaproteobacteria bacterium]